MNPPPQNPDSDAGLRRWVLGTLVLGLVGTGAELLLQGHYEGGWQYPPLVLIAAACVVLGWHVVTRGPTSALVLQVVMALFLMSGGVGVALHYRGAAEFQKEIDPTQSQWTVFLKVVQAKTPPVLAPGMMVQLGLLGLIYTYRRSS